MRSPRILGQALGSAGADRILAPRDPLLGADGDLDRVAVVQRLLGRDERERAERIAAATRDPIARERALGYVALARGDRAGALDAFVRVLSRDPSALQARAGLVGLRRQALLAGEPSAEALAAGLDAGGASAVDGWRAQRARDWAALETLELRLAALAPQHPLYAQALRLRATWRLESGAPEQARVALELLDELVEREGNADDLVLRARAAARGRPSEHRSRGPRRRSRRTRPGPLRGEPPGDSSHGPRRAAGARRASRVSAPALGAGGAGTPAAGAAPVAAPADARREGSARSAPLIRTLAL